jgi:hypothetical protein
VGVPGQNGVNGGLFRPALEYGDIFLDRLLVNDQSLHPAPAFSIWYLNILLYHLIYGIVNHLKP